MAVLAVVMTTLMFTTLFVLSRSMSRNMLEMAFRQTGYDAQVSFKTITEEQIEKIAAHPRVKEAGRSIVLGLAENEGLAGRQVEIRYGSDSYAAHSFALPETGRMPQGKDEIALDTMVLDRLGIPHELGQQVTLEWRQDMGSDLKTSATFNLCGYWEGNASVYASMAWVSEEFVLEACNGALQAQPGQVAGMRMLQVTLESDRNIEADMQTILADTGLNDLSYGVNLAYDPAMQAGAVRETLPMYFGMVLVFLAGYLIIYNIFQISVGADIAFYGRLKTLGSTKKQLKKLVYSQANRICLRGIPIGLMLGYLLGAVLVPVLIAGTQTLPFVSADPVIFIGSALFAWITVLLSCLRPARIAGKVSPMEALRYTDVSSGGKSAVKRSRSQASLSHMAWANLGRNKKRTFTVVCSLTLGLVLLSCFYAKNAAFDMEKYLSDLTVADFELSDSDVNDVMNGYNPLDTVIKEELTGRIEALAGLEATGRLYSQETQVDLSQEAADNILSYYEKDGRLEYMDQTDPAWADSCRRAAGLKKSSCVVYGVDGLLLDVLGQERYLADGTFDAQKFKEGGYCMAVGIGTDDFSEQMPTFSVGEKVVIGGSEFTVMGVLAPIEPIVEGLTDEPFTLDFILPAESFGHIWPDNTLRKFFFDVDEESMQQAQTLLTDYQQQEDQRLSYSSRAEMEEQYRAEVRSSAVMGNAISVIIALVGVLNFVNSMVTAIVSRRREFAVIQSVGMTRKQLLRMLVFEGLSYTGLTLAASYALSSLAVGIGVRAMVEGGFTTFRFTLWPLFICTPVILAFAAAIPYVCFRNLEKQSLVERLRME